MNILRTRSQEKNKSRQEAEPMEDHQRANDYRQEHDRHGILAPFVRTRTGLSELSNSLLV